jgi:hypothetical protein
MKATGVMGPLFRFRFHSPSSRPPPKTHTKKAHRTKVKKQKSEKRKITTHNPGMSSTVLPRELFASTALTSGSFHILLNSSRHSTKMSVASSRVLSILLRTREVELPGVEVEPERPRRKRDFQAPVAPEERTKNSWRRFEGGKIVPVGDGGTSVAVGDGGIIVPVGDGGINDPVSLGTPKER